MISRRTDLHLIIKISTNVEGPTLNSRAGVYRHTASAQRRALFRKLLRSAEIGAALSVERPPRLSFEDRGAEHVENDDRARNFSESARLAKAQFDEAGRHAISCDTPKKDIRGRERRASRYRRRRDEEVRSSGSVAADISSMSLSWSQRLDYLINVATGVLVTALVISWALSASKPGSYADPMLVVANAQTGGEQQGTSPDPPEGFNILSRAFPKPLPTMAEDVATLLFLARPSFASAPGVVVFPYADFPKALKTFPKDIADLIMIATPQRQGSSLGIR